MYVIWCKLLQHHSKKMQSPFNNSSDKTSVIMLGEFLASGRLLTFDKFYKITEVHM
jgi:hypothetical protein